MQKFAVVFVPFKTVFQRKAHLKPPNYPYYLFLFLSPKLVEVFGAVIEWAFWDALVRPAILTSGRWEKDGLAYILPVSRDEFPCRNLLRALCTKRGSEGFSSSSLSCLPKRPNWPPFFHLPLASLPFLLFLLAF